MGRRDYCRIGGGGERRGSSRHRVPVGVDRAGHGRDDTGARDRRPRRSRQLDHDDLDRVRRDARSDCIVRGREATPRRDGAGRDWCHLDSRDIHTGVRIVGGRPAERRGVGARGGMRESIVTRQRHVHRRSGGDRAQVSGGDLHHPVAVADERELVVAGRARLTEVVQVDALDRAAYVGARARAGR